MSFSSSFRHALPKAVLAPLTLSFVLGGCSVMERRTEHPTFEANNTRITTRVSQREGKRVPTWKPFIASLALGSIVASSAMIWVGFLEVNRPLSVSGLVVGTVVPIAASIPFILRPQDPWIRTRWQDWAPAPDVRGTIQLQGSSTAPLRTLYQMTAADGVIAVDLRAALCRDAHPYAGVLLGATVHVPHAAETSPIVFPVSSILNRCAKASSTAKEIHHVPTSANL